MNTEQSHKVLNACKVIYYKLNRSMVYGRVYLIVVSRVLALADEAKAEAFKKQITKLRCARRSRMHLLLIGYIKLKFIHGSS